MYGPEQQQQYVPPGEPRPLNYPLVPPPPVLGQSGPAVPGPPMPPGPPVPQPMPAQPKKSYTGLVVILVAVVLALCGGGGVLTWLFAFDGKDDIDGPPTYPQTYTLAVAPAPAGQTYETLVFGSPSGSCDLITSLRLAAVIFTDQPEYEKQDHDDSVTHSCDIALSNTEDHPDDGANGWFEFDIQQFDDPARAVQDFETNEEKLWADSAELPVDGLDVRAQAYDDADPSDTATRRTVLQAVDGDLLITVRWQLDGVDGATTPAVPLEVLAAMSVDFVNEALTNL